MIVISDEQQTTLYLFRHGETEWSASGRHTGRTDIPLTDSGRVQARMLEEATSQVRFSLVLVSPLSRAQETAALAGLKSRISTCEDLAEFSYGEYEGLTTTEIREKVPNWTVWTHDCPGGETVQHAGQRCQRVIDKANESKGNVALFAHGHILRILTATWLKLPPTEGKHFILDTSTMSILSHERDTPAIKLWNEKISPTY